MHHLVGVFFADVPTDGHETSWHKVASVAALIGDATAVQAELSRAFEDIRWAFNWIGTL